MIELKVGDVSGKTPLTCECKNRMFKIDESEKLGAMINQIVSAHKGVKTKIKLEIEFGE